MTIRQIVTDWDLPGGLAQTVMFFSTANTVAQQRTSLGDVWEDLLPFLSDQASFAVQSTGSEIDEVNGTLEAFWSDQTAHIGTGALLEEPVADSTQVLLRWLTGEVADSHAVVGRSFVPGLGVSNIVAGEISDTQHSAMISALSASVPILFARGLGVWHRPIREGVPPVTVRDGSFHPGTAYEVWQELAVQRRRRS